VTSGVGTYLDALAARLAADGCEVSTEDWGGMPVLVGYRSEFRLRWFATKLHLFVVAAAVPEVTPDAIEGFTTTGMDYALARKGSMRGLQSGVAVLPALVGPSIDPAAVQWAKRKQRNRFACMARPVVVDPTTATPSYYKGRTMVGAIYQGYLLRKLRTYFPRAA
jgi:hypothetical protein